MSKQLFHSSPSTQDDHWIPLSDLMTGLMMIFLLVAIVYMIKVEADSEKIKEFSAKIETRSKQMENIALLYEALKTQLYNDLRAEFAADLPKWEAELLPDSTVRFKAPDVLFQSGRSELRPRFRQILDDFFPRYVAILASEKYRMSIQEVRVEGHTSSFWKDSLSDQEAYFKNLTLSQERTRSTLEFVMDLQNVQHELAWLRGHVTANGLSYSKRIRNVNGTENYALSQRVEFRVRTDSEARLENIIATAQ